MQIEKMSKSEKHSPILGYFTVNMWNLALLLKMLIYTNSKVFYPPFATNVWNI